MPSTPSEIIDTYPNNHLENRANNDTYNHRPCNTCHPLENPKIRRKSINIASIDPIFPNGKRSVSENGGDDPYRERGSYCSDDSALSTCRENNYKKTAAESTANIFQPSYATPPGSQHLHSGLGLDSNQYQYQLTHPQPTNEISFVQTPRITSNPTHYPLDYHQLGITGHTEDMDELGHIYKVQSKTTQTSSTNKYLGHRNPMLASMPGSRSESPLNRTGLPPHLTDPDFKLPPPGHSAEKRLAYRRLKQLSHDPNHCDLGPAVVLVEAETVCSKPTLNVTSRCNSPAITPHSNTSSNYSKSNYNYLEHTSGGFPSPKSASKQNLRAQTLSPCHSADKNNDHHLGLYTINPNKQSTSLPGTPIATSHNSDSNGSSFKPGTRMRGAVPHVNKKAEIFAAKIASAMAVHETLNDDDNDSESFIFEWPSLPPSTMMP
ncbi:hypothetical protein NADFUDRAFT_83728 [Nadsonia fulvescens var. elongata DSM 6958]|uniref:Uncharacterized protein n=1 Tax=Nadsonia fulvescens var. elongata DSM 6958 TaxID=857566 RepID=A0A1E3PFE9_9ASCO|nr:hypothetical protein NADFUDRAFT_83728 [Nadsonia fulvescens var. elongata DSM 6958]